MTAQTALGWIGEPYLGENLEMEIYLLTIFPLLCLPPALPLLTPPWPGPYWDIPGSYCQSSFPQEECCPGRKDRCSVPILGTLCYCDTFCNRPSGSDCCPDYFSHCQGLPGDQYYEQKGPAPATILGPPHHCPHGVLNISEPVCTYHGRQLSERDTARDNCNQCKCQVSISKPGCMDVMCTTNQCMLEEKTMAELKDGEEGSLYSWKPANYTEFWGKTLEEGIRGKLGAEEPDIPAAMETHHMSAVQLSYTLSSLPTQFNSLVAWPGLISPVPDQGWCSSSWAVSAVGVAGDRTSIGQGRPVVLSSQALLACGKTGPEGCVGGHVYQAWDQLRRHGSWSSTCQADTTFSSCPSHCHMHRTQPAYRVGRGNTNNHQRRNEHDIMYELMTQGPVQAVMEVYTDFFMYSSGVYRMTNLASHTAVGYHAVRIVGWGQEGGERYWRVANSWGSEWGEKGFFRIARGVNECLVEEFVLGVWPRKKRSPRKRNQRHRGRAANSGRQRHSRHSRQGRRQDNREGAPHGKKI